MKWCSHREVSAQLYLGPTTRLEEIKNLPGGPGVCNKFMAYASEWQISEISSAL